MVRSMDMGRQDRRVVAACQDPRIEELRGATAQLHRRLAAHRTDFPDRAVAEEELAALGAMAREGTPDQGRLRRSLLVVAASLGSVSALATELTRLRAAVELFGTGAPG
ncbi:MULTISPECIES: DUF5955 family protein [Streptomyces]|uniref:Uncharacterized protein n=3 Tax=Streptomyces TaxID=1883 RepID=A0A380P5C2_STRGR|nr:MULTISPECIES: DUF5955 family protein [unclassified Streptomyces]MDQ0292677.1 hypothetical protein [Streptomyces sp. DSM 41037]RPK87428.1 hypothetical protein EES47_17525 [Streptomyces sp. ADI98-12]WSU34984.1 DUF5955 family protein [Streptomyces gougerotii]SUP60067.1 Uncharacterised protein [Streptomyces griseus]